MYKKIYDNVVNKETFLYVWGWLAAAFFFSWGNTSLGMLLLLIHTIYIAVTGKYSLFKERRRLYKLVFWFLCWALFVSFFAHDVKIALASTIGYGLLLYIFFFGAWRLSKYKEFLLKIVLPVIVIGISISSLYPIYLYLFQNPVRSHTFFVNFNGTGTVFTIGFIILLGYFDYLSQRKKLWLIIPLITSMISILLSYSRGAFLGIIVALTVYYIRSKKHLIILALIFILLLLVIFNHAPLKKRYQSIFSIKQNMDRIHIWISTSQMFKEHYFFGIGPGNFPKIFPDYALPESRGTKSYSHNIFLNMFTELGILGGVLFIYIIINILKMGYYISYINSLFKGLFAAFIGTMVHEQFDCIILGLEIGNAFWLIAGLIVAFYYRQKC